MFNSHDNKYEDVEYWVSNDISMMSGNKNLETW